MLKAAPLAVAGYQGPGLPELALGAMLLPAEPAERYAGSVACVQSVLGGEYRYPRGAPEDVRSIVDIGFNIGTFTVWACRCWWPGRIARVVGYEPNAQALELARVNAELVEPTAVMLIPCAVSLDAAPRFSTGDNWGGGRTHGVVAGQQVPAVHPRDLPPADVLKCDAEGVDADVFEHYQHWAGVRVALFEWHEPEHRARMEAVCRAAGLVQLRGDQGEQWGIGMQVWGR